MTTLRAGSATDVGRVRSSNQDAELLVPDRSLYGVADGMGGHQGGEVAAAMAVELAERHAEGQSLESLMQAARVANRSIFEKAGGDPDLHGMGTTLVALQVVPGPEGDEVAWINVGDSRIYLLRDGELRQLSHDHTLVADLVRDGKISDDEAKVHPQRNIITRALGIDLDVNVDGSAVLPLLGDRFLLCSDGLFNEVTVDQMAAVLRRLADPVEAAEELVRLANEGGGRDNITVVVVDVLDDDGRAASINAAQAAREAAAAAAAQAGTVDGEGVTTDLGAGGFASPYQDERPALADQRSSLPDSDADYGAQSDDLFAGFEEARARRFTWRVVFFAVAVLALVGLTVGAVGWSARNTYFVGFDGDRVAVFKGKPGGVLWFDPTLDGVTDIERADLTPTWRAAVAKGKQFSSRAAADRYLIALRDQVDATTTTTTTTTTSTTPTTTAPATSLVPTTTGP